MLPKFKVGRLFTYLEDGILFCGKYKVGNDPGLSSVLVASKKKKEE